MFVAPNVIFLKGSRENLHERVNLVMELGSKDPVIVGPALLADRIAFEYHKWVHSDSRLAPGTAAGVPWK